VTDANNAVRAKTCPRIHSERAKTRATIRKPVADIWH